MSRPRALDLFCRAGGVSEGLRRAGFDVVGVDILDCSRAFNRGPGNPEHPNPARFVQADALEYPLEGFDFIWASPPCQRYSSATRITGNQTDHPDLIVPTRERLTASGSAWCIENVPGASLGASGPLLLLCGSMFGLQTPDGRAELRRHRWFETSFSIPLRPACQHGSARALSVFGHGAEQKLNGWTGRPPGVITVCGDKPNTANTPRKVLCVAGGKAMSGGMMTPQGELRRRAEATLAKGARTISVTGSTPQTNVITNQVRETFSTDDARAAMGIPWMAMKDLSQAIPPAYSFWVARQALAFLEGAR